MSTPSIQTDSLHCPACGYNLFGITSERCSECGLTIDRSVDSRIPWTHRRRIGRMRAFWRTVFLSMLRPRILAQEVNRPVSYVDAIKFRRVCLLLAELALLALIGVTAGIMDIHVSRWECIGFVLVCGFSTWLFLLCITGLPSLFFHPRDLPILRQNRAVALSFYAAGPLAWMFVPVILVSISLLMMNGVFTLNINPWMFEAESLLVLGFGLMLLLFCMHASSSAALLKHSTLCTAARRWTMRICFAIAWLVLLDFVAIGIPVMLLYLAIMVQSLK